jgi:nicotinate-nucleotide pyrophosphorylase (carboxylating)
LGLASTDVTGDVSAHEKGVVAGTDVARIAFEIMEPRIVFDARVSDGERVARGGCIAAISGSAGAVLSAERVALNFLQRLSGVATLTSQYVEAVSSTGVKILDTRKTTPLSRELERYAVRTGGGHNHRFNLSDMMLVKENHVRSLGGVDRVVTLIKANKPTMRIEVEVDSLSFLDALLGAPVDQIMLENFTPAEVQRAVGTITAYRSKHPAFQPAIEVSGGVTLQSVREYAIDGVDFISIGAITHSAPALDISLEIAPGG